MPFLVATKPMIYKTRRLQAGEEFEVKTPAEARIWIELLKKAAPARKKAAVPPPPKELVDKVAAASTDETEVAAEPRPRGRPRKA